MNLVASSFPVDAGSAPLIRALSDPRVVGIAQSMNLNLQDPRVLKGLLKRTRQIIESSTEVSISTEPLMEQAPMTVQNTYARNAIRTYQQIERLA